MFEKRLMSGKTDNDILFTGWSKPCDKFICMKAEEEKNKTVQVLNKSD